MKRSHIQLPRQIVLLFILAVLVIGHSTIANGQKLPPILKEGSGDPSAFDVESVRAIKAEYDRRVLGTSDADKAAAKLARNRLIGIGREQIDAMFHGYIKKDRKRRQLVQFVLDFLEIGAAAAITLTNGERARTVISEGLGALQASRTSLNKNFQLLERQVLINKMAADRATILTGIFSKRDLAADQYSWEDARAELRSYRDAGTIDGAMINLSAEVGQQKEEAEEKLREVTNKTITAAATVDDLNLARDAFAVRTALRAALADTNQQAAALTKLQAIVTKLSEVKEIAELFKLQQISPTTANGQDILAALPKVNAQLNAVNRRDLVAQVHKVTIELGTN